MYETVIGPWILCHVPNAECAAQDALLDRFLLEMDTKYVATDSLATTKESSRVLVGSGKRQPDYRPTTCTASHSRLRLRVLHSTNHERGIPVKYTKFSATLLAVILTASSEANTSIGMWRTTWPCTNSALSDEEGGFALVPEPLYEEKVAAAS
ncbi:hypothetical protein MRX96_054195 [Rhipicephalus microplus]